jgi:hypothetical protein
MEFVRGAEEDDELCIAANSVACGEMRPAMVGLCLLVRCTGYTLMPFVAVVLVAYNVFRLPTAREPTVRAAKGCPPPFMEADYPARGGQRPQAAPR